jgi:hypothetical protein
MLIPPFLRKMFVLDEEKYSTEGGIKLLVREVAGYAILAVLMRRIVMDRYISHHDF